MYNEDKKEMFRVLVCGCRYEGRDIKPIKLCDVHAMVRDIRKKEYARNDEVTYDKESN